MQNMDIAVVVLIAGLVVVFMMLIILTLVIKIYSTAIHASQNKKKSKVLKIDETDKVDDRKTLENQPKQEKPLVKFDENQDEIIAVIAAAVAFLENEDDSKQYKVKSVKRRLSSSEGVSLWSLAGKLEATTHF